MGTFTYRDGIAVIQLLVFPFILAASLFIWKRTGWRAGSKIWRYGFTLSLIRIVGSICTLLTINYDSYNLEVAVAVCELIGLPPLLLLYVGLLRQIDPEHRLPQKLMLLATILGFVGLALGISGVSAASGNDGSYQPGTLVKTSMATFIGLFMIITIMVAWLYSELVYIARNFQRRLFLAIFLSYPFVLIRIIYSSISDYADIQQFSIIGGDPTTYLCMNVLEEIIAVLFIMVLGMSAVTQNDFVKASHFEMQTRQNNGLHV